MLKKFEKKCIVLDDVITLKLTDTRDQYVVQNALGEIGTISISKDGTFIYPSYEYEDGLGSRRESELLRAFGEIFGTKEFEPLSSKYYYDIKEKIEKGELKNLGYEIEDDPDYNHTEANDLEIFTPKRPRRH